VAGGGRKRLPCVEIAPTLTLNTPACRAPLSEVNHSHLVAVTATLLRSCGVTDAHRWCPVVACLAVEAANTISPAAVGATGSIDPRGHLKVCRV